MSEIIERIISIIKLLIYLLLRNFPIEIIDRRNTTEIKVSLSKLTVECTSGEKCLTIHNNKAFFLLHESLMTLSLDPLFTGIEITENWRDILEEIPPGGGSIDCYEPPLPPPPPGGGGSSRNAESTSNASTTSLSPFTNRKAKSFIPEDFEIAFLPYNEFAHPEAGTPFLSVSLFDVDFGEMLNHYLDINENQQDQNVPLGQRFSFLAQDVPQIELITQSFTVYCHLGHYVTIVKTSVPNRVFRFAYREQDRFEKSVELDL